jgi:hypothetical protein
MTRTQIIMALGSIGFIWAWVKKPEWIAILLFTSIVADVNFNLPLPLNYRAMVTLAMLAKVFMDKDKDMDNFYPKFGSLGYTKFIAVFLIYVLLVTAKNHLLSMDLVKEFFLYFCAAFLCYYWYFKKKSYYIFKWGMIWGGLIMFGDLAYTYAFIGYFPVQRFYYLFLPGFGMYNHNFFGYICGASFVFLLADYLNSTKGTKINLLMMPIMFLGTLLSTSRSSLLLVVIFALVLIIKALFSSNKGKKAYTLLVMIVACLFITLFIFQIITSIIGTESEFLTTITGRLIDEPVAMLNRALGNNYVEANLDSMDWRAEASATAYDSFVHLLKPDEQLLGIGYSGYLARDYGHGYDAHNGILLMLIEFGVAGFIMYVCFLFGLIIKATKLKLNSPFSILLIYMIMYVSSHNKEITACLAFMVTASLTAQIQEKLHKEASLPRVNVRIRPSHQ